MYSDYDVFEMYKNGKKITHIMRDTGFSYAKVKRILVDYNIFESKGTHNSGIKRKSNLNDNYFEIIDTKEKAYWMGFIWGDGYITNNARNLGISVHIKDIKHLEKFKDMISFTGKIGVYKVTSGYKIGSEYSRILFSSPKMVSDLKSHGLQENKSKIMKPPVDGSIPKEFIHHFIRGLQDANGSICGFVNKYGKNVFYTHFLGTLDILEYIKENIKFKTNQKYTQRYENCPVYDCRFTMTKTNLWILDFIYKDSAENIRLDRKYEEYLKIKKFFN